MALFYHSLHIYSIQCNFSSSSCTFSCQYLCLRVDSCGIRLNPSQVEVSSRANCVLHAIYNHHSWTGEAKAADECRARKKVRKRKIINLNGLSWLLVRLPLGFGFRKKSRPFTEPAVGQVKRIKYTNNNNQVAHGGAKANLNCYLFVYSYRSFDAHATHSEYSMSCRARLYIYLRFVYFSPKTKTIFISFQRNHSHGKLIPTKIIFPFQARIASVQDSSGFVGIAPSTELLHLIKYIFKFKCITCTAYSGPFRILFAV